MNYVEFAQSGASSMYREATARHAKYAGVTLPSFRCRCCGKNKPTPGRQQIVKGSSKYGYRCAECVEAGK